MQTQFKCYLLLLLLACFNSCQGQKTNQQEEPVSNTFQKAGLPKILKDKDAGPNDGFRSAFADRAGNLWFGTTGKGVYRYDGTMFSHFTTKDGLIDNSVTTILEDNSGTLWFGTDAGICRYDGKRFTYVPIPVANGSNSALINPAYNNTTVKKIGVTSLLQDRTGKLWFCTTAGVYCSDGKTLTPFLSSTGLLNKKNLNLNAAQSVLEDKAGNIWFATWFEGIVRYDGKELTNFTPNNEIWFVSLLQDLQGNIWTSRRGDGMVRHNGTNFENVLQHGTLDSCTASAMLQDRHGNIWFTAMHGKMALRETTGGLWCYDGKTFTNFTIKNGLPSNTVMSVIEDKTGNIWAGTRNMGLVKFDGKTLTSFVE